MPILGTTPMELCAEINSSGDPSVPSLQPQATQVKRSKHKHQSSSEEEHPQTM